MREVTEERSHPESSGGGRARETAVVVLTPAESKRLIARAVARLPEVRAALQGGRVIVATGSTNAYVAEEILGQPMDKARFITGHIRQGALAVPSAGPLPQPLVLVRGERKHGDFRQVLQEFEAGDVFIKGANAVDPQGYVGILLGSPTAGTIGAAWPIICARGCHLVVPVGLEKLVPSVRAAARACQGAVAGHSLDGGRVSMMPLVGARVVTEIEALEVLAGVSAHHVASGGIDGSEGSVVLVLEGSPEEISRALAAVRAVKGEPPFRLPAGGS